MGRAELAGLVESGLVERVRPTTLARDQLLPVLPALEPLLPGAGLRRGSTLSVDGSAATSLGLAAAAAASQDGAWVAAVGFPSLGLLAAAELGVALERFVLVASPDTEPGPDNETAAWSAAVAALVDAFEVVLVRATHRIGGRDGRRLAARTRERDAVLVQVGSAPWPEGADVTLTVTGSTWEGLGEGFGHLRARRVTVTGGGRRDAARPRQAELWLPSVDGAVEAVLPDPVPLHARGRDVLLQPRRVQPVGPSVDEPVRTIVVWVPDWPLVAAGVPADERAAVFVANRVVACTAAARAADVRRHMRRREAQSRCPSLQVLDHDPDRDARAFETVVLALESLTARIEVSRPGRCAFPTRGPSRYFGGDAALAERATAVVASALHLGALDAAPPVVTAGIADGPFAASQAARTAYLAARRGGCPIHVVEPGATPAYLAPLSLGALDRPELADVLGRLGIHTLGGLAALPVADVLGRFGTDGAEAHRLARGLDARPPATTPPPPDLVVSAELDPPAEQVAGAAFVARGLAEELHRRLASRGSACTRIVVTAETENGERSERVWRHADSQAAGALTAGAIADRVRWQLDGWINAPVRQRPTAGIVHLEIRPDEVVPADGHQLGFWGGDTGAADRAVRAIARVQGLLGIDAVNVAELAGGRDPGEQLRLVPAGAVDLTAARTTASDRGQLPWPGRLPNPSPATVHAVPEPIDVVDRRGRAVVVDGRCEPTAAPARLRVAGRTHRITSWAGPWPVDERWWDAERHSRRARFQVVTDDGTARLVVLERGRWTITATYD